jgi:hypothetical protein
MIPGPHLDRSNEARFQALPLWQRGVPWVVIHGVGQLVVLLPSIFSPFCPP